MSKTKTISSVKTKQSIIAQLESSLAGLKDVYGEKKFEKKIKKAAKLLSPKKKAIKKAVPKRLTPKKAAKAGRKAAAGSVSEMQ